MRDRRAEEESQPGAPGNAGGIFDSDTRRLPSAPAPVSTLEKPECHSLKLQPKRNGPQVRSEEPYEECSRRRSGALDSTGSEPGSLWFLGRRRSLGAFPIPTRVGSGLSGF